MKSETMLSRGKVLASLLDRDLGRRKIGTERSAGEPGEFHGEQEHNRLRHRLAVFSLDIKLVSIACLIRYGSALLWKDDLVTKSSARLYGAMRQRIYAAPRNGRDGGD